MKLKLVLVLLVVVCMNGESSPVSGVKMILKGITATLEVLKPTYVVKILSHDKNILKVLLDDVKYKIIKDEEGFKVFKKIKEKGKWMLLVGGVVEETNVLHAASASLPCILSDKEKKKFFNDRNLTSSDFNQSRCQPTEDVINSNSLKDMNGSQQVDKIDKSDWTSFK